jgi:hypothetical protein
MKTIIKWSIVITLLSIQSVVYSQNFIDETKQWTILADIEYDPPYPHNYVTKYFKFSGDSILNLKTYYKLYESPDSNQVNWNLNSLWYERNDSVFQYYSPTVDILVYDFNIEENDSFHLYYQDYMKVDSIRFLDWGGSIRKHWFFCATNSNCSQSFRTIWIEGVGQLGLFTRSSEIGIAGAFVQLLCFQKNGNLLYQNPNFTSCYVHTTPVPSIYNKNEVINCSPNPATIQFMLTLPQIMPNATYSLYDMQGRKQIEGKTNNALTEINVAVLPRGLYILKIITDKQVVTKKIILQ